MAFRGAQVEDSGLNNSECTLELCQSVHSREWTPFSDQLIRVRRQGGFHHDQLRLRGAPSSTVSAAPRKVTVWCIAQGRSNVLLAAVLEAPHTLGGLFLFGVRGR